jgi:hypothetical protein
MAKPKYELQDAAWQVLCERNSRTAGGPGSRPARLKGLVALCRFEGSIDRVPALETAKADFERAARRRPALLTKRSPLPGRPNRHVSTG